ncbi:hypothetical protein KKF29_02915 [Patescibacteria group bacterium]|nr:hypothetical protein [Patescibacteria group bacterium]
MSPLDQIQKQLNQIQQRNKSVEADKAWETSYTRRLILLLLTYLAIAIYFNIINVEKPWLNAVVPAVAFMLSTLTLPYFKKIWLKIYKK